MRRCAVEASREHLDETRNISRHMLEKAMHMRCVSYFADAKSSLLTQTIFEIGNSKKNIIRKNRMLTNGKSAIKKENQLLEQKIHERARELTQTNRALSMLNRCNQLQIHAKDETELLEELCKHIASEKVYSKAWINLIDPTDPGKAICPLVYAGICAEKPDQSKISSRYPGVKHCPPMAAIQRGIIRVYKVSDIEFCACPLLSAESGCRSLICLPLKTSQETFGSLNITSMKANAFHENEVVLLENLASDISFGIHSFRLRGERDLAHQKIQESLHEKDVMLREIHHRVRNNLQIVISLLRMQSRKTESQQFKGMAKDCEQRIMSLESIHEELYRSDSLISIHCQSYFTRVSGLLLSLYKNKGITIHVDAGDTDLTINNAIPCGLIFHELVSNALKHAFPENRGGNINVSLKRTNSGMEFMVADNGIGLPHGFDIHSQEHMGLQLVTLLAEQLNATIETPRSGGAIFRICFAAEEAH